MAGKSILSASFEESKKIVSKKILTEDGAQIGIFSSMSIGKRFSGLLLLFLVILIYAIGVGLPKFIGEGENILLTPPIVEAIIIIGNIVVPLTKFFILAFICLVILNIFPKPNYAYQLAYGNMTIIFLIIVFISSILPFTLGMTLGSFGWIGLFLQTLICAYLWKNNITVSYEKIKNGLYKYSYKMDSKGERLNLFLKRYGGVVLFIAIINRWTFNIGEIVKGNPGLLSFLLGWSFLIAAGFVIFMLGITLQNFIAAFYFFKYRNEYRQYFKISDELWYGKWRAKLKSKFRK